MTDPIQDATSADPAVSAPEPKMRRAIVYTRFSPRRDAEKSESCEIQEEMCRRHAEAQGYDVAAVYQDKALSGGEEDRPGLWDAVAALRPGNVLLVLKLDRLARGVYLSECIRRSVARRRAAIEAVQGDVDGEGPEQDMIRHVLAAFSEYERKIIAARTRTAMLRHQAGGRRMSKHPPYGWRDDPDRPGWMLPHDREREAIALAQDLEADGMSVYAITDTLNREMRDVARGDLWSRKTVTKLLRRELD